MTGPPSGYSVQYWLECAAQGYLLGTEHGHLPGQTEPEALLADDRLREQATEVTVQLVLFERFSLVESAGLIPLADDDASRCFLATQTLDEARHMEVFARRLLELGVPKGELEAVVAAAADPNLVRCGEVLYEQVERGDFLAALFGQNVLLEGMAKHVLELLHAASEGVNPKFAHILAGVLADESRHAFFGASRVRDLIRAHPERRLALEQMQREMVGLMSAAFSVAFRAAPRREERVRLRAELIRRSGGVVEPGATWQGAEIDGLEPEELERRLARGVAQELKQRLEALGLEFHPPMAS